MLHNNSVSLASFIILIGGSIAMLSKTSFTVSLLGRIPAFILPNFRCVLVSLTSLASPSKTIKGSSFYSLVCSKWDFAVRSEMHSAVVGVMLFLAADKKVWSYLMDSEDFVSSNDKHFWANFIVSSLRVYQLKCFLIIYLTFSFAEAESFLNSINGRLLQSQCGPQLWEWKEKSSPRKFPFNWSSLKKSFCSRAQRHV